MRKKTITVLLFTFCCAAAAASFFSDTILLASFERLERDDASMRLGMLQREIDSTIERLNYLTLDWANWDDTYAYAEDRNAAYVQANLGAMTFVNQELQFIGIYDGEGAPVFLGQFDTRTGALDTDVKKLAPILAGEPKLFTHEPMQSEHKGLTPTPAGPLLFSSHPILNSTGEGPAHGTLVMGKFLSHDLLRDYARRVGLALRITTEATADAPLAGGGGAAAMDIDASLAVSGSVKGYSGEPVLNLKANLDRSVFRQGRDTIRIFQTMLAASGVLLIAVTLLLLERLVLAPLRRVTRDVDRLGVDADHEGRLNPEGPAEIRTLSLRINQMLESLARTHGRLAKEVAERRRAEESLQRFESMIENGSDIAAMLDKELRILYLNRAGRQILGVAGAELIEGSPMTAFHPLVAATRLQTEAIPAAMEQGSWSGETTFLARNGHEIPALQTIVVHRDSAGVIAYYSTIARDMTERIHMEREMLRTEKLESIGLLAGGLAHDFNNLLTAILGNISLLERLSEASPERPAILASVRRASVRARDLTQQLLTFAKGGKPVVTTIALETLVREAAGFVLSGTGAICEYEVAQGIWPVQADSGQLAQVVQNLIANALYAMGNRGRIRVGLENRAIAENATQPLPAGPYAVLSVADDGPGIAEEIASRIFDPYFTTKEKGNGLGLAVCHSIVKNHHGYIAVDSTPGAGAVFTVYLPAAPNALPAAQPPEQVVRGRGRILVMDDEKMIREMVHNMLVMLGYSPALACDGAEALALYREALEKGERFAAVIMDLTIPGGMGGRETIGPLLEIDPDARVIVSSGYSDDRTLSGFREFGFVQVMPKPFSVEILSRVLKEALEGEA